MFKRMTLLFPMAAALLFSQGCGDIEPGNTSADAGQPVRAAVATARAASSQAYYEAVGTLKAETAATLSGKLIGAVRAVNVREGDRVSMGQILVLIDDRQVSAQLRQAKAALEEASKAEAAAFSARDSAKAGAELAQSTHKRFLRLIQDNAASRQEFEEVEMRTRQAEAVLKQAEAGLEAAKERVKQAEAGLASADVSKKDAEVSAPFDGFVTARMADVGDLSAPGVPLLTVEKSGALEVEAIIPEDHIQLVTEGQALEVVIPSAQDRTLQGTVKSIITSADIQSRSFKVRIGLPDTAGVHSGMFARVRIPSGLDSMLTVPSSAIVMQGQLTGLFVLDENMIAHFRIIRTGRKTGDSFEVISGLRDDAAYVLSPPAGMKDGTRVEASS